MKSRLPPHRLYPLSPSWIPYQLANDAIVTISIYNIKGQLVRTLRLGNKKAGTYITKSGAAYWDGKDATGEAVSSGIYFYQIKAGEFSATRKMLMVK
ncbi:TPA: T9SS type A sorting domain-containing protein [Candidatus Poribacteria bacterium]|nr:T9SS type A sorting domain-containing protein [Candidatus Poribacteria bacterium]